MSTAVHDQASVTRDLIEILTDMTQDWDTEYEGGIQPADYLMAKLGFRSIDWVYFVTSIEQRYGRTDFPFVQLFVADGKFVGDLPVQAVVDFLVPHLNKP